MSGREPLPHLSEATGESVEELRRLQGEVRHHREAAEGVLRDVEAISNAVHRMSEQAGRWLTAREADLVRRKADAETWEREIDAADREVAHWWRSQMALRGFGPAEAPPPPPLH